MTELNLPLKIKKINKSDIIGDSICCLSASCALSMVLLNLLGHDRSLWYCLLLCMLSLAIILIFSRKWWLFPLIVVGGAVLSLIFCTIFGFGNDLIEYVRGFYQWVMAAYPVMLPYSENGSIIIVQMAVALPVTFVIYLYFRRFFIFAIQPVGFCALLVWVYFRLPEHLLTVFAPCLVSMSTSLAKHTGRMISRKNPESEKLPVGMMQIPAFVIALIILLFSFATSPKTNGSWQAEWLDYLITDISDYLDFHIYGIGGMGSYSISHSGYQPYGDRLGGDINPTNDVVLRIETDIPVLLLGSVNDTYMGSYWYDSGQIGRFRFHSAIWQGKRRAVFSLDKPYGGRTATELYETITDTVTIRITPTFRSYTLFYGGKPLAATTRAGAKIDAYFNLQSELYYEESWKAYSPYVINTVVYDRSVPNFDRIMLELEKLASETEDSYYDDIKETYLQLPADLPERVSIFSADITAGANSPYEKAMAINNWLSENCVYTLTPGDVPEDRDFVDYFLETREGYCTYFASAMTVLARCAELPARYCTGYAMMPSPDGRKASYTATNRTAHAWTEIYFSGIGWVAFDPSGWSLHEPVETDIPDETPEPIQTPQPPVNEVIIGDPADEIIIETPQVEVIHSGRSLWPQLLIIPGGAILLLIIVLIIRFISANIGADSYYRRLCRRYQDRGDRLDAAYRKLLGQLGFLGLKVENADTISTFTRKVDEHMGNDRMSRICRPVISHRFGLGEVSDSDIKALCDLYTETEAIIRKELGIFRYLFRRILLGK
jgi:transglutaminase-like putative cysteine protease